MITSSLTLSYAEAHRAELYRQAENRIPSAGISHRLIRRTAVGLAVVIALAAGFAAPAGAVSPSFDPTQKFDVAGQADSVAVGDFDGDGVKDIAASYGSAQTSISLWLGTGDTTTPFEYQSPDLPAGDGGAVLKAADLNADGRDDLVAAASGQSTADDVVSIFLGSAGGLVPGDAKTVRDAPAGIDVGDLDGDGDLDLAVANLGLGTVAAPSQH
ncbi:MAG TPA: VCBS repeat-containing protein, partial [Thermoleophilaceae bacterium]|nr:VCBS repeat-containing protein [Thermoleophilaceae bacterium]